MAEKTVQTRERRNLLVDGFDFERSIATVAAIAKNASILAMTKNDKGMVPVAQAAGALVDLMVKAQSK